MAQAAELEPVLLDLLRASSPSGTRGAPTSAAAACSLTDARLRDAVLAAVRDDERVLLLGCGTRSVHFRPALTVSVEDLAAGVAALDLLTRLTASSQNGLSS